MTTPVFLNADKVVDTGGGATFATPLSFTANAGSARFIEVWVGIGTGATPAAPTSVTWGGAALAPRGSALTSGTFSMSKWYLAETGFPSGATGTIQATFAAGHDEKALAVMAYSDVDQASPYRNGSQASENDGSTDSPSINVTSNAIDLVSCGLWVGSGGDLTGVSNSAGVERADTGPIAGGYENLSVATVAGAATATLTFSVTHASAGANVFTGMMADSLVGGTSGDTTAPTYGSGPTLSIKTPTTAVFTATASDETASTVDHYMAVYAAGSTPTAANVKAATGTGLVSSSNRSASGVANGVAWNPSPITGLSAFTSYRAAFTVEEAGGGNLRTVTYVDFQTPKLYPRIRLPSRMLIRH